MARDGQAVALVHQQAAGPTALTTVCSSDDGAGPARTTKPWEALASHLVAAALVVDEHGASAVQGDLQAGRQAEPPSCQASTSTTSCLASTSFKCPAKRGRHRGRLRRPG